MMSEKMGYVALEFPQVSGHQVVRAAPVPVDGTPSSPSSESKIHFDRLSISEAIVPHRTQVDSPAVFCGHLLKLVLLVGLAVLALLFAQCLLYLLYLIWAHCVTPDSNDTRSLFKKITDDFFGAFKSYRRNWN